MIMSLPHAFATGLDTIPGYFPYLKVVASAKEAWRGRLEKRAKNKLRFGIAWTGRPEHRFNAQRSLPPGQLQRLLAIEGVTWVCLQGPADGRNAPDIPDGVDWLDWGQELSDFSVTAAIAANLDLVISIDSVNVHLAGALGLPVWLLNRRDSEWRWMAPREDSPWYPSLRIFRQREEGGWEHVIGDVIEQARKFVRDA